MRVLIGGAVLGAALIGFAGPALAATTPAPSPSIPSPSAPAATPSPSTPASPSATPSPSDPTIRVEVFLKPSKVAQGGRVKVGAYCFSESGGTAESSAFGRITLKRGEGGSGAEATVRSDAKPGEHAVKVTCAEGGSAQAVLTVVAAQTKQKPVGGAETGAGGTVTHPAMITGMASVALGGAAVAWLVVRRRGRA